MPIDDTRLRKALTRHPHLGLGLIVLMSVVGAGYACGGSSHTGFGTQPTGGASSGASGGGSGDDGGCNGICLGGSSGSFNIDGSAGSSGASGGGTGTVT